MAPKPKCGAHLAWCAPRTLSCAAHCARCAHHAYVQASVATLSPSYGPPESTDSVTGRCWCRKAVMGHSRSSGGWARLGWLARDQASAGARRGEFNLKLDGRENTGKIICQWKPGPDPLDTGNLNYPIIIDSPAARTRNRIMILLRVVSRDILRLSISRASGILSY